MWQISGRSDLNWEDSLRLDLWYVDNWSPVLDVMILIRTVRAVVKADGALLTPAGGAGPGVRSGRRRSASCAPATDSMSATCSGNRSRR